MESYKSLKASCNNQDKALHSGGNNSLDKPVALHLLDTACRNQKGRKRERRNFLIWIVVGLMDTCWLCIQIWGDIQKP